jgi:hypothetical protein
MLQHNAGLLRRKRTGSAIGSIFLFEHDLRANASHLSRGKKRYPLFRIVLYLPEILYAFILVMFVSAGAVPYSLDAAILRLGLQ